MRKISILLAAVAMLFLPKPALAKDDKQLFSGEKPTKEYTHAVIQQYLNKALYDPYSAHTECGDVTEKAWIIPVLFMSKRYGYFVVCYVNAKNQYGGYVGSQRYVFRFNGGEYAYEPEIYRFGLYDGK
jgi:hypothetical protein